MMTSPYLEIIGTTKSRDYLVRMPRAFFPAVARFTKQFSMPTKTVIDPLEDHITKKLVATPEHQTIVSLLHTRFALGK